MEKTFQLGLNNKIVNNQWHLVNHIEEFNLIYMTDNNNCSQTEGDLDEVKVLALYSVKVLFTSIVFAICQQEWQKKILRECYLARIMFLGT